MAKERATVTTCDNAECDEHAIGRGVPETWLSVAVVTGEDGDRVKVTFCSWACLNVWSYDQARADDPSVTDTAEAAAGNGG